MRTPTDPPSRPHRAPRRPGRSPVPRFPFRGPAVVDGDPPSPRDPVTAPVDAHHRRHRTPVPAPTFTPYGRPKVDGGEVTT